MAHIVRAKCWCWVLVINGLKICQSWPLLLCLFSTFSTQWNFVDYRLLGIKGKTKLYGHFTVKDVYKCKINYSTTAKYIYNVSDTLILFKQLDLEFIELLLHYWKTVNNNCQGLDLERKALMFEGAALLEQLPLTLNEFAESRYNASTKVTPNLHRL